MRLAWIAVVVTGCDGVFGLIEVRPPVDAVAADAATICDHGAPFETVTPVAGLSDATAKEIDVWLSPDELQAIVTLGGPQQTSWLVNAARASVSDAFVVGADLAALDARSTTVGSPTVTADGLTIYFDVFAATPGYDIEAASRASPDGTFESPAIVPDLNSEGGIYDRSPMLNATGDRIYWSSTRGGDHDLWSAERVGAAWVNHSPIYVAPMRYEAYLVPSSDDRALYFGSSATGLGSYEMRVITRGAPTEPFGPPRLSVLPVSFTTVTPAWLSADNCRMYLAAEGDLYLATRSP